eukprot:TRINITY_DN665_c0_g1_i1.p1 TRINITY_DN665_c0_g1~~TRINITY_DN665_c0_g1_i1.p1  ORF type:complete len:554 (-),score=176.12 TRINITY_DN665_c0_g1_i1:204-1796(-)
MFHFPFGMGGGGMGFDASDFEQETRRQPEKSEKELKDPNHTKLYETLGVAKTCTDKEIKSAFRKLAMTHHPDKGGDPEKFKEITKAYEILSNSDKRKTYDEDGEEAAEQRRSDKGEERGGSDMDEVLEQMFGVRRSGGGSRQRKGEDCVFPLKVDLAELFNGGTKKLRLTRNIICTECKGAGGKGATRCTRCSGRGFRVVIRSLGHNMITQSQTTCEECKGQGTVIPEDSKCSVCSGNKTLKEKKTLEVTLDKGMYHGQKITFKGEADEAPDTTPGDVVVVIQQKEHPIFHREGMNLFMKKKLTLLEALTGFQLKVPHLDGRTLIIKSEEGSIVKPGDFKAVRDEGMPKYKASHRKGDLFIEFDVEFPAANSFDKAARELLKKVLPNPVSTSSTSSSSSSSSSTSSSSSSTDSQKSKKEKKKEKKKAKKEAKKASEKSKDSDKKETDDEEKEGDEDDDLEDESKSSLVDDTTKMSIDSKQEEVSEEVALVDVDMDIEKKRFMEQRREVYEEEESSDDGPSRRQTATCHPQ